MNDIVRFTSDSVDVIVDEKFLCLDIKGIFAIKISNEAIGRFVKNIFEKPQTHIH